MDKLKVCTFNQKLIHSILTLNKYIHLQRIIIQQYCSQLVLDQILRQNRTSNFFKSEPNTGLRVFSICDHNILIISIFRSEQSYLDQAIYYKIKANTKMQNYKLKQKIIKTKPATYYRATYSSSTEVYIVKKLNKPVTWQDILQSKSLTLCKNTKCKFLAKVKEIIKEENSFYCVMENAETNLTQVIKNDIERKDILRIAKQLVELVIGLHQENILIRDIRPAHLFTTSNKNSLKLYHFETVSQKDLTQLDLTQLQDLRYIAPQQVLTRKGYTEKSLIFSIGLIICQLILGEPLLNAKNKLQYIYQLTHLFPQDRIDKMKGSQHEFNKQVEQTDATFVHKMRQQSQIGQHFVALLERMLKIDHSERISVGEILEATEAAIQSEEDFLKNKDQMNKDNNLVNLPNKNQVDIQSEVIKEIEFDFENKPTLSTVPLMFSQKARVAPGVLPEEENVEDDGNQPIIIKQATSGSRAKDSAHNLGIKKGSIQKANQPQKSFPMPMNNFAKPPPIYSSESPAHILMHYGSDPMNRQNEMLKNSRSTKQTTLNTIKKPQLTNYALNEANLGLKVGMNNTLFSDNNYEEEEFV